MKLRNKKTGEIVYVSNFNGFVHLDEETRIYTSLAELNEEWEDYEEPKEYWYIDDAGVIQIDQVLCSEINMRKSIGNYFETEEEAKKAVECLRAWKRLKDKGFRFIDWELDMKTVADGKIWFDLGGAVDADTALEDKSVKASMDLLFGGEE